MRPEKVEFTKDNQNKLTEIQGGLLILKGQKYIWNFPRRNAVLPSVLLFVLRIKWDNGQAGHFCTWERGFLYVKPCSCYRRKLLWAIEGLYCLLYTIQYLIDTPLVGLFKFMLKMLKMQLKYYTILSLQTQCFNILHKWWSDKTNR